MITTQSMHVFIYRFLAITCGMGLISCILSTWFLYTLTQDELSGSLVTTQQISTELLAQNVTQNLGAMRQILYSQASLNLLTDALTKDPNKLNDARKHLQKLYFQLKEQHDFMLINHEGIVLLSTDPQSLQANLSKEGYVQNVLANRTVQSMHLTPINDQQMNLIFTEALFIDNKIEGVLAITTPVKSLLRQSILNKLAAENQLETYLFEADGTILLQPKAPSIQRVSARTESWFAQFRRNPLGSFVGNINGVSSLANFTHIPSTTWTLMLTMPEDIAFAPITKLLKSSIITNALLLIGTMLSIIFLIRKPIIRIQNIENLQKAVLNASQNMYTILNSELQLLDATEPLLEKFGAPSKEHFIEFWRNYTIEVQPNGEVSREVMLEILEMAADTGKARCEIVFCTYKKTMLPLEVIIVPLVYQKQKAFLLAFSDLQEQKAYEQSLRQAQYTAESASKAKSEFLANMSHEIRTPMNAIVGMAHLAKLTDLTPKQLDYVQKIELASKSLLTIINDILDFSKIEAGHLTIETIPFLLNDVLEEVTTITNTRIQEKKIELIFNVNKNVPNYLIGDPIRLAQVLTNLLTNAVKFTSQGEIIISISAQNTPDDQVIMSFSIKDTGIGMKESQIDELFSAFTQADASTTRRFGGTGLGLTICKQLVTLMHGTIWATSVEGEGSTFAFTIKIEQDKNHSHTERAFEKELLKDLRILIVDDNDLAYEILEEMTKNLHMLPTCANSGEKALKIAQTVPPFDLVIIDLHMPGMNGLETSNVLRTYKDYEDVPFILITAYEHDDLLQAPNTFCATLAKPVSASTLVNILVSVFINKKHARPALTQDQPQKKRIEGHVLLAEDNLINQQVASEMFESLGLQVSIASNGQEALEMYKLVQFDAIFMDIQMPIMDGIEATQLIREHEKQYLTPHMPIIAMTAHALTGDYQKSLDAGMDDHITKPIDPVALTKLVHKLFTRTNQTQTSTEQ